MRRRLTTCLLTLFCLTASLTFAQETTKKTAFIANTSITEHFTVLKDNKKMREGEFTATFKKITVAKGNYKKGKRVGSWSFTDAKGKLVQVYNYDINKFVLLDTPDTHGLKCFVENVQPADVIKIPVKIGGSCYGLLPLVYRDELAQQVRADFPGLQNAEYTHIIIVDATGKIISHKVNALVNHNNRSYTLDDSLLDPDVTAFTPATVNGKPVTCRITTVTQGGFYGAILRNF